MQNATYVPTPASRHRFHLLDALRGLAALAVVDLHTSELLGQRLIAHNAHLAVDFFFCLSGFVIGFSYERRLEDGLPLHTFFTARLIRLYPMIFIAMTIGILKTLAKQLHHVDSAALRDQIVAYLHGITLIPHLGSGYHLQVYPLDNPAWSIFFELVANAAFALLVFRRRVSTATLALVAMISLAVLAFAVRAQIPLVSMGSESLWQHFALGVPRIAFSFAMGVLALRVYRRVSHEDFSAGSSYAVGIAVTAALLFVLLSPFGWMRSANFQLAAVAIVTPALVFLGATVRIPDRLAWLCNVLGETSYPLYLLHVVANYVLAAAVLTLVAHSKNLRVIALPLIMLADVALAYAVGQLIDLPIRRYLTRRFQSKPRGPLQGVAHA